MLFSKNNSAFESAERNVFLINENSYMFKRYTRKVFYSSKILSINKILKKQYFRE